jgi:ATP-dependent Clp protease ATP-binding subunit ClpX
MEDVKLTFTEDARIAVAKKAILRKTGARGLRSIMEGILLDSMFELPTLEGVTEVVVNAEVVECRATPLYIYEERRKEASAVEAGAISAAGRT